MSNQRNEALTFLALLGAGAVLTLCVGPAPWYGTPGFLLGLAAAHAQRVFAREDRRQEGARLTSLWPLVPVGILVAVNVLRVGPLSSSDPRHYDLTARSDLHNGRVDQLEKRMDFFDRHSPDERKTHWFRARSAVAQGQPDRAAAEFAASLREPSGRMLVPPPNEEECEEFLVALRDYCSALPRPNPVFAHERALVADGRWETALELLKLRAGAAGARAEGLTPEPFAHAVAHLLGDAAMASSLSEWPAGDLLGLLDQWGGRVRAAPSSFPSEGLPLIATTRTDVGRVSVRTQAGGTVLEETFAASPGPAASEWTNGGWSTPAPGEDGAWRTGLSSPSGLLCEVLFPPDVVVAERPCDTPWSPAIAVWLPIEPVSGDVVR